MGYAALSMMLMKRKGDMRWTRGRKEWEVAQPAWNIPGRTGCGKTSQTVILSPLFGEEPRHFVGNL
jgi:hypothetical protein